MRPLFILFLLAPALAGCLGGDDIPTEPSATGTASDLPILPEGLSMDAATVVDRDKTSIVFAWNHTVQPGPGPAVDEASTQLLLPAEGHYRLLFTLAWEAADHVTLELQDGAERTRCITTNDLTLLFRPAVCGFPHIDGDTEAGSWTVSVAARPAAEAAAPSTTPIPFTVEAVVQAVPEPSRTGQGAHVVLGFEDSGINPYHEAFRDPAPQAYQHPATYLAGYPADATPLNLTLDAASFDDALEADKETWESVERGRLYWIPGTKIVGAVALHTSQAGAFSGNVPCYPILDCYGHGTQTTSRAIGTDLSLCPSCLVTMASDGPTGTPWLAAAPWVDLIVDEFVDEVSTERTLYERIAQEKPLVAPTMNYPVPGFRYNVHAPSTIGVGGHDSGQPVPTQGSMPHVVADSCKVPTADHDSVDGVGTPSGTSYAAPFAAGAIGEIIRDARDQLGDHTVGVADGILAQGDSEGIPDGPLADGEFTLPELKEALYSTADPRPEPDPHDGDTCADQPAAPTSTIPEDVPAYYFLGYGAVNEDTLDRAKRVLRGEAPMPERPVEEAFFALDQEVRQALVDAAS